MSDKSDSGSGKTSGKANVSTKKEAKVDPGGDLSGGGGGGEITNAGPSPDHGDTSITVPADNSSDVAQATEGLEEPVGSDTARDREQKSIVEEKHRMSREAADRAGIAYVDDLATPVNDPVAAAMRRQNTTDDKDHE